MTEVDSSLEARCKSLQTPPVVDIAVAIEFAHDALRAARADLAIALLQPLCELSAPAPQQAHVWQALGCAYRDEQRMAEATAAMARAAALLPEDPEAALSYAQICFTSGLPAAGLFARARQLAPDHLGVTRLTAIALEAEGEREAAEAILIRALAANPDWLEGHQSLTTMRWTRGQRTDFAFSYAEACRAQPRNLALRLAWFYTLAMLRDWEAATAVLDEGERAHGETKAFRLARLLVASETGVQDQTEALIQQTESVVDAGVDICRIRHYLRTMQLAKAEAAGLRLSHSPAARLAWPYLSVIWRLRGDPQAQWLDGAPPCIKSFDLPLSSRELMELAALLRKLHTARAPYLEQSVRGGTQTDRPLFFRQEPIIARTKAVVVEAVRSYIAALPAHDASHPLLGEARESPGELLFAGSWSVRLQAQGFHVSHTHPMGWISSALYVALPEPAQMGAAPAGWLQFGTPPLELGLDLAPYAQIEPEVGRLVLFPSTLWHSTVPFDRGERLVVAFDVSAPR